MYGFFGFHKIQLVTTCKTFILLHINIHYEKMLTWEMHQVVGQG